MRKNSNLKRAIGWLLFSLIIPVLASAQDSKLDYAQSSPVAVFQRVLVLEAAYETASDIMRPNIARRIAREMSAMSNVPDAEPFVARASIIISRQASTDGRKGLALRKAREAEGLSARVVSSDGRILRVRAASVVARALLLHENYLDAVKTTTAARRAFGPIELDAHSAIDELLMWDAIARTSAPDRMRLEVALLSLPQAEADTLDAPTQARCTVGGNKIERNIGVGIEPIFPVLSGLRGVAGGVVTRSNIDANGTVINAVTSAYSPTQGFAAAAERAALTWRYSVPAGISAICLANVRTVFSFGSR